MAEATPAAVAPDVANPVLEIAGLDVRYGRSHILQGVDLAVGAEPLSLIGRNGMGKTTLCNAITGLVAGVRRLDPDAGTGARRPQAARDRPGRASGTSPRAGACSPRCPWTSISGWWPARSTDGWTIKKVYDLFPPLATRRRNGAMQLSGGEQQMLAIARALLLNPHLLIMDEPSEGLAPIVVEHLVGVLRDVAREGVGLLLVEQNLGVATSVSERIAIMVTGQIALRDHVGRASRGRGRPAPLPRREHPYRAPGRGTGQTLGGHSLMASVVLLGTLDTKGAEYEFLRDRVRDFGCDVILVDAGVMSASAARATSPPTRWPPRPERTGSRSPPRTTAAQRSQR